MTTTICELKPSANGSSRAALQRDGADLEWKAKVKTSMPWQPNSYDESSNTLDFCFRPTAELLAWISELEAEVVAQVAKDSETYFGKALGPDEVKATLQSALRISNKGTEHMKMRPLLEHQVLGQNPKADEGAHSLERRRRVQVRRARGRRVVQRRRLGDLLRPAPPAGFLEGLPVLRG